MFWQFLERRNGGSSIKCFFKLKFLALDEPNFEVTVTVNKEL
jgi:hypothetical protein